MSRTPKKIETYTNSSLQLLPVDSTEECAVITADDNIEDAPKQRKKEADKPLYLKRI